MPRPKGTYKYHGEDVLPYLTAVPQTVEQIMRNFNKGKRHRSSWLTIKRALDSLRDTCPSIGYRKIGKYHTYFFFAIRKNRVGFGNQIKKCNFS